MKKSYSFAVIRQPEMVYFSITSRVTKDGGTRASAHGRAVNGRNRKNIPFPAALLYQLLYNNGRTRIATKVAHAIFIASPVKKGITQIINASHSPVLIEYINHTVPRIK